MLSCDCDQVRQVGNDLRLYDPSSPYFVGAVYQPMEQPFYRPAEQPVPVPAPVPTRQPMYHPVLVPVFAACEAVTGSSSAVGSYQLPSQQPMPVLCGYGQPSTLPQPLVQTPFSAQEWPLQRQEQMQPQVQPQASYETSIFEEFLRDPPEPVTEVSILPPIQAAVIPTLLSGEATRLSQDARIHNSQLVASRVDAREQDKHQLNVSKARMVTGVQRIVATDGNGTNNKKQRKQQQKAAHHQHLREQQKAEHYQHPRTDEKHPVVLDTKRIKKPLTKHQFHKHPVQPTFSEAVPGAHGHVPLPLPPTLVAAHQVGTSPAWMGRDSVQAPSSNGVLNAGSQEGHGHIDGFNAQPIGPMGPPSTFTEETRVTNTKTGEPLIPLLPANFPINFATMTSQFPFALMNVPLSDLQHWTTEKNAASSDDRNLVLLKRIPNQFRHLFPVTGEGQIFAWRYSSIRRSHLGPSVDTKDADDRLADSLFQSRYCFITNFRMMGEHLECIPFDHAQGIPCPTLVDDAAACLLPYAFQPASTWIPATFRINLCACSAVK